MRKHILALLLCAALLCGTALAHSHPGDGEPTAPAVSSWAREEIGRAETLGLLPAAGLPEDFAAPMTRGELRLLLMQFLARQNHSDLDSFQRLIAFCLPDRLEEGMASLTDASAEDACAYAVGLIQGDGAGSFHPGKTVTRQEAAVLLVRAYTICGGLLPESGEPLGFHDIDQVSQWAVAGVAALAGWDVIRGDENGNFLPEGTCTVEQGILLLLRLYEQAPMNREKGNLTPLFTYQQVMSYLDSLLPEGTDHPAHDRSLLVEGPEASLVRLEPMGVMGGLSSLFMVHRQGGLCRVDLGLCNTPYGQPDRRFLLEGAAFTEDGRTFTCTATLEEDVISYLTGREGVLLHEKGTYRIAVPVDSPGRGRAERLPD